MRWILGLNTLVEGLTAIALFVSPQSLYPHGDALTFSVARAFGAAVLSLAVLSAAMLATLKTSSWVRPGLVALCAYHVAILAVLVPAVRAGFSPPPPLVVHAVLAGAFITLLVRDLKGATPSVSGVQA